MGALIQARKLRKAADGDVPALRNAIAEFLKLWQAEIQAHFDEEEVLLLPSIDAPEFRERLLNEHRNLRDMSTRCERNAEGVAQDPEFIRRLGNLLNDHVRWEERVLFEAIQRDHPQALSNFLSDATTIVGGRTGPMCARNRRHH